MFKDRELAGKLLAEKIVESFRRNGSCKTSNLLVVGLPRGGVPVAKEVALSLRAALTVLVSKKIGAPFQPEFAIGAVSSMGVVVLNKDLGVIEDRLRGYIESERKRLTGVTKTMEKHWLNAAGINDGERIKGKWVILVDDGVATGMTTLAAIRSLKYAGAARVILATPVIAAETAQWLRHECDQIICLMSPHDLNSVGAHYLDFHQVEDDEVVKALKESLKQAGVS